MNPRNLLVLIIWIIAASCNSGFQGGTATQNGKVVESIGTSTTMDAKIPTATLEAIPTRPIVPPDEPGVIPREEFTLDLDYLTDIDELPSGEHLVLWDRDIRQLDLVAWDGTRTPLFTIIDSQSKIDEGLGAWPLLLPPEGKIISIGYLVTDDDRFVKYSKLYYLIDLESGDVQGLATQCETAGSNNLASLGLAYFGFRCLDDLDQWNFLSLYDPSKITSIMVPFRKHAFDYMPRWISPDLIEFNRRRRGVFPYYYLNLETGDQWSEEYPIWIGDTSPNGAWVEVREGSDDVPNLIGVVPVSCMQEFSEECTSRLTSDFPLKNGQGLEPGIWSSDQYVIYLGSSSWTDVPTTIWIYDVQAEEIIHVWEFPDYYEYRMINQAPAIWAPDGRLLIEWMDAHEDPSMAGYLLNIEDGSLTKLYEGGQLLGTVQIP